MGAEFYPPGVSFSPRNPRRPFQARVSWRGRRISLGYYPSIAEAEGVRNTIKAAIMAAKGSPEPPPLLRPWLRSSPEPPA
jgi:hypothetical protein